MPAVGHVIVIGGGIAGASAAYFLAKSEACSQITLLEAESQLAHHSTGRSAALLIENYGTDLVRPLTTASLEFLYNPPPELVEAPVLSPRGILTVALDSSTYDKLDREIAGGSSIEHPVEEIDADQAAEAAPHLRISDTQRYMWESHAHDIDVAGLHQAYVRGFRARGGQIATSRRVDSAHPVHGGWTVETTQGPLRADAIVNAAGAWGDLVAAGAALSPVGLEPRRRTAFMVNSPFANSADYAVVAEVKHSWYVSPDGSQFLCSPADETLSEPCDAKAEEIDIARTIDMVNEHTRLQIRSVASHWAGLRTFAPDRVMVIGPDPDNPTFFWCVGQGGTGIQTSPGAGQLVSDLVTKGRAGPAIVDSGLDVGALLPDRFRPPRS